MFILDSLLVGGLCFVLEKVATIADQEMNDPERQRERLLDVLDSVLNHGVVVQGDLILGVANVDLIYVKLSALLAAIDKIAKASAPRSRHRRDVPGIDRPRRSPASRRAPETPADEPPPVPVKDPRSPGLRRPTPSRSRTPSPELYWIWTAGR